MLARLVLMKPLTPLTLLRRPYPCPPRGNVTGLGAAPTTLIFQGVELVSEHLARGLHV